MAAMPGSQFVTWTRLSLWKDIWWKSSVFGGGLKQDLDPGVAVDQADLVHPEIVALEDVNEDQAARPIDLQIAARYDDLRTAAGRRHDDA